MESRDHIHLSRRRAPGIAAQSGGTCVLPPAQCRVVPIAHVMSVQHKGIHDSLESPMSSDESVDVTRVFEPVPDLLNNLNGKNQRRHNAAV